MWSSPALGGILNFDLWNKISEGTHDDNVMFAKVCLNIRDDYIYTKYYMEHNPITPIILLLVNWQTLLLS